MADAGLLAHGRGEAFDYILGERTTPQAEKASHAAAAMLLQSKSPVISVNGNAAALTSPELVELADVIGAKLEVNLFYRSEERAVKIAELLKQNGASEVLGVQRSNLATIPRLESERKNVDRSGISRADTVLVPLEDGDRTEALRKMRKQVIAIDLNPLSRTARTASITIVDNLVRAVPLLASECRSLANLPNSELQSIIMNFDNRRNLSESISYIVNRLENLAEKGEFLEAS